MPYSRKKRGFRSSGRKKPVRRYKKVFRRPKRTGRTYQHTTAIVRQPRGAAHCVPKKFYTCFQSIYDYHETAAGGVISSDLYMNSLYNPQGGLLTNPAYRYNQFLKTDMYQRYLVYAFKVTIVINNEQTNDQIFVGLIPQIVNEDVTDIMEIKMTEGAKYMNLTEAGGKKNYGKLTYFGKVKDFFGVKDLDDAVYGANWQNDPSGLVYGHLRIANYDAGALNLRISIRIKQWCCLFDLATVHTPV